MAPADERARRQEVGRFFDDFQGELLGFLLNMGLNLVDSEDVLNESFKVIWQYWHKLRDSNPRAYLYKVARNLINKRERMRGRKPEDLMGDSSAAVTAGSAVITMDFAQQVVDRETLRWALQKLTKREREAVLLRHFVECDVAEAAMIMGVAMGTVRGHTSTGLKKLNRLLTGGNLYNSRKEEGA